MNGVKFTISDDSHGPDDVGMHYDKLYQYLVEMGIDNVYIPCIESPSNSTLKVQKKISILDMENQFFKCAQK